MRSNDWCKWRRGWGHRSLSNRFAFSWSTFEGVPREAIAEASRFWRSGQFWSIWGSKVRSSRSPSRWAGMVLCRPHQRQSRSWCSCRRSMKGPCEHAFSWWSWVGFRRCRLCQKPTPLSWASAEMASWSRMYPSLRRRVGTSQRRREWTESQTSCTLWSEW